MSDLADYTQADARLMIDELAAKNGVAPPRAGPLQILDYGQAFRCRRFLQFKSQEPYGDPAEKAPEAVRRAARILLARAGATLNQTVWGLPDVPEDPETTDFGDVRKVFDRWAENIHAVVHRPGRHRLG